MTNIDPKEVTAYSIFVYGSEIGAGSMREMIYLYGPNNNELLAIVKFHDPGMTFFLDAVNNNVIFMNLPSEMFNNILDILRNEKPVYVRFNETSGGNYGTITTSFEQVGEGETI